VYSSPNTSRMGKVCSTRERDQKWTHSFHWERCLGKPRPKWKDNINKDLKKWIYLVQDKTLEPTVLNMVTNLQYISVSSFLTGLKLEVQSVWGFNLMLNTSVCLTENTHSLHHKHTPAQRRCEHTCSSKEAYANAASYKENPANTTEPAYDISLKYVPAITNEFGIPRLPD